MKGKNFKLTIIIKQSCLDTSWWYLLHVYSSKVLENTVRHPDFSELNINYKMVSYIVLFTQEAKWLSEF